MKYTKLYLKYIVVILLLLIAVVGLLCGVIGLSLGTVVAIVERDAYCMIFIPIGLFSGFIGFVSLDIFKYLLKEWELDV